MADTVVKQNNSVRKLRHRGRASQISIYFGKLIRMFVFQNDWKVLPLSAVIAGMVAMVVRNDFFLTREGTLKGALALSCVAMWNGCFNSIQVICRERAIVKREHRSGMHVSAYTFAHMLYQALLCLMQTFVTIYVCKVFGVEYPKAGIVISSFKIELGITIFLITFASDMMSLFISSFVHSTTAAMTVMPFVLIFQLVFSGGVFPVPEKLSFLSDITVSNYGMKCISAEAGYNELPMVTGWNTLNRMRDTDLEGTLTVDQIMTVFRNDNNNSSIENLRSTPILDTLTLGDAVDAVMNDPNYEDYKEKEVNPKINIGDMIDIIGEEKAKEMVLEKTGQSAQNAAYDSTGENILTCWLALGAFVFVFFFLTLISLKLIDRDKR
ncbi:MAG: ABC transporter permease [Eubacteriales bacterium]|nr:ABC transporter permease [Eubacteriales bacterium]